ncbi:MAG: formylglycine-generating enzyme family protein [Myxococcota bacterium]
MRNFERRKGRCFQGWVVVVWGLWGSGHQAWAGPEPSGMVLVPAGSFQMGSPGETRPARVDAFFIDRTEVTVEAYALCVNQRMCTPPATGALCNFGRTDRTSHPVNCVSWAQAVTYCASMGKRLPLREEWEKAARGTGGAPYPWGDDAPSCSRAVYFENQNRLTALKEGCGGLGGTQPVGSRPNGASPFGLMDMAGNVAEWVLHWAPTRGPRTSSPAREVRGGAYSSVSGGIATFAASAARPTTQSANLGFRCVQSDVF